MVFVLYAFSYIKQTLHEERYLLAEISKIENQMSSNGADPVLIKQLSTLNSQFLNYQSMKAKKDYKQIKQYFTDCHHGDAHSVNKTYLLTSAKLQH